MATKKEKADPERDQLLKALDQQLADLQAQVEAMHRELKKGKVSA